MLKKVLIAAGVLGAALAFQTPANADVSFGIHFGSGTHYGNHHDHYSPAKHAKKHAYKGHGYHKPAHKYGHHRLTNRELRYRLRQHGLYKIRFVSRYRGVANVVAHNNRGYVARYAVSTRNGRIIDGHVIRPIYGHGHGHHGHRAHRRSHGSHVSFSFN